MAVVPCVYTVQVTELQSVAFATSYANSYLANTGDIGTSLPITSDGKKVNSTHTVYYKIGIFAASDVQRTNPLPKSRGAEIDISAGGKFATWKAENPDLTIEGPTQTLRAPSGNYDLPNTNYWYIAIKSNTNENKSVTPKFKVQLKPLTGNDALNTSGSYVEVSGVLDKVPTINFTKSATIPNWPTEVAEDAAGRVNGQKVTGLTGYAQWNACEGLWEMAQYQRTEAYYNTPASTTVYLYRRDKFGALIGTKTKLTGKEADNIKQAQAQLRKAYQCIKEAVDPVTDVPPSTVTIEQYPADEFLNPPNHLYTRDIQHSKRVYYKLGADNKLIYNQDYGQERVNRLAADATAKGRLGTIFQDKDSATALNFGEASDKIWGFRFIYNPTTISYSTGADMSVDWMLSSKDPANYIGGNTNVSFQLYLNRIADMTELRQHKGLKGREHTKNYPNGITLKNEAIQGILYRGTEYDLEFLYRVVNGSPRPSKNGLLTYTVDGNPALTSDFGYITGTPVWVRFNDNLRYKGSISTISVNHIMFTEEMIPMFTVLDVTFTRYPITGETDPRVIQQYTDKRATESQTGNEEPKTAGGKP